MGGRICEWRGKLGGRGGLNCEVCDGEALLARLCWRGCDGGAVMVGVIGELQFLFK
ncbi:hypothetical protein [Bartonella sp. MR30HLJHH]|uniref:hypothetical protein n=1 Tax=Bartonella sp. MR30HLJHH TaxID=3243557 RepID=UPI0035CFE936